ncbi:hypothetical protein A1O3_09432 [Capronia epimyces CBS 606.96]|uniref:Uncharacterized protein n=1 Tax=Capronia epimyces CBS 606.96 TaxID=1182542 RepID=W9XMS3_9EURO|nr:uncharacterized protein A1O3_09432 [Capronia epimyces CBS 606.96]EXJ78271.1 hypothetical protein A1O3_09432 [Capronia epimyces CBS 606.96]
MEKRVRIWTLGSLAGVFSTASSIVNLIVALNITVLPALRILLFVSFGISLLNLANLAYFATFYVRVLNSHPVFSKAKTWSCLTAGTIAAAVSVAVPGAALVWLALRHSDLPQKILDAAPFTLLGISLGTWAASALSQLILYCMFWLWTKSALKTRRKSRLDMDFGIRATSVSMIRRPSTQHTSVSFGSQDPTVNSPPRTPISKATSSLQGSSSTKVGPGSSRTKLIRHSNHSSFEGRPFPAGEAMSIDSAFGNWDTSSAHHEMRAVIPSSPPVARTGLETIPGSRSESPANGLDGPFVPETPVSSSPHATTSDSVTMIGWSSSPREPKSSPPSSPPNFSRPTSSPYRKPPPSFERFDPAMHELVHPLFRPNSPRPPPVPLGGTAITVSPLADHLISPSTLTVHRKAMPSIAGSETQSVDDSVPDSPTLGSPSLGSPGPSIVDDDELPPILPGFVLSAGSRTSLVGYGKRKGFRQDRPKSHLSSGNRLSGHLI